MATTDAEMLVLVNAAITSLLSGAMQSYSIDGVTYTKLDLVKLRAWRDDLSARIEESTNRTSAAGMARVAKIRGPG